MNMKWLLDKVTKPAAPRRRCLERRTRLSVQRLEDRSLMTATLFVDFGDAFPVRVRNDGIAIRQLDMTVDQLRNTLTGPNLASFAPALKGTDNLAFTSLHDWVGNSSFGFEYDHKPGVTIGDSKALKSDVLSQLRRYFAPFNVDVVVNSASSVLDVQTALARNNQSIFNGPLTPAADAYVFITGMQSDKLGAGLYGQASVLDVGLKRNQRDETAIVMANQLLRDDSRDAAVPDDRKTVGNRGAFASFALSFSAAHEAAHTFGLDHTFNPAPGQMPNWQSWQTASSDIMAQRPWEGAWRNYSMFTRWDLQEGNAAFGSTPQNAMQNAYDQFAADLKIDLRPDAPAYVTGTGAHDRITISASGAQAVVTVQAFADANMTALLGTRTYAVAVSRGIVVDTGAGDDETIVDAKLNAAITLRGMAGSDRLIVDGAGLAAVQSFGNYSQSVFPHRVADTVVYGGSIRAGNATIAFDEFNVPLSAPLAGSRIVARNFAQFTVVPPTSLEKIVVDNPEGLSTRVYAAGDYGMRMVPMYVEKGVSLTIDAMPSGFGGSYLVQSAPADSQVRLVLSDAGGVVILGGDGTANAGGAKHNNLNDLGGTVSIKGGAGKDSLLLYDQAANDKLLAPYAPGFGWTNRPKFTVTAQGIARENTYSTSYRTSAGAGGNVSLLKTRIDLLGGVDVVEIFGGGAGNAFAIQGKDVGAGLTVHAGDGNDVVVLGSVGNSLEGLNQISVDGQKGADSLTFNDQGASGAQQYAWVDLFGPTIARGSALFGYNNFERLAFNAGHRGVAATVADLPKSVALSLSLGDGTNVLTVGGDGTTVRSEGNHNNLDDVAGKLTVKGGAGRDTLRLNDQATYDRPLGPSELGLGWSNLPKFTLTAQGVARENKYSTSYRENLGGGGSVGFYTTTIDFVGGIESVEILGGKSDDVYRLDRTVGGPSLQVTDAAGRDTLLAPNTSNAWTTTGATSGRLVAGGSSNAVSFSGIEGWIGGAGADSYTIAAGQSILGWIDAAAGIDTLSYAGWTSNVYVNLRTNAATNVAWGVWNVQNVIGGAGNDILVGDGGNSLAGGAGRDLLIAGLRASVLDGGAGEDMLIAGSTSYDLDERSLRAIRDVWSSTESSAFRVAKLTSGNGAPRLGAATVQRNGAANVLRGAEDSDLFFAVLGSDALNDRSAAETAFWL